MLKTVLLLLLFCHTALAEEFAVVANKHFPIKSLNSHQVKQIYLKRLHYIANVKLLPINLPIRNDIRANFENNLLQMSMHQLKQYWTKAHYQGKRPPMVKHSVQSAIALVREVDGAIAYIPSSQIPDDLILLYVGAHQ